MDRPGVFPRGSVPRRRGAYRLDLGAGDSFATMQGAITLDLIEECDLVDNGVERGRQFTESMVEAAMRRGCLTLGCGARSVRVLPRLAVTGEIALGVEHLQAAIETTT